MSPHDIAVSSNGREVYVGELASSPINALHKFELAKRKGKNGFLLYLILLKYSFIDHSIFLDLPTQTFSKRIYLNDRNFRVSLIIMTFFAVPVLLAVIIGCCVRMRNIRKLRRLNTFLNDVKATGTGSGSVLGDWMNRRKGFEKLDQYSDGENEPLDNTSNNDLNTNSNDEINQQQPISSSINNNIAFKMGASL